MLATIEEQKKSLAHKLSIIAEQQEDIDSLSQKIQILEHSISEDKDVIESQREIIEKYEKKMIDQTQVITENEFLITESADKINVLEKDLKNKEEVYKEKLIEIGRLKEEIESKSAKLQTITSQYKKLQEEGESMMERAAGLHLQVEDLNAKNKKYKKQVKFIYDEKQKEIDKLKDKMLNGEMEIIKFKALLKEREQSIAQMVGKKNMSSDELNNIVESNYKIFSEYERSTIKQDYERQLEEQREKMGRDIQGKVIRITELEEKYSTAMLKIQELRVEISTIQQSKSKAESRKFRDEKAIMIKTLNDKDKKIKSLEKDVEDLNSKISGYENFLNEDQKASFSKIQNLTKNMNQLKQMYTQIVNSESVRQEKKILEKRLLNRDKKIAKLEHELSVTREQWSYHKDQAHILAAELNKHVKTIDDRIYNIYQLCDKIRN